MPRLSKDLVGAEPVDRGGQIVGPTQRIAVGASYEITIPKLKGPADGFDEYWCEIRVEGQLYRVSLRALEMARVA